MNECRMTSAGLGGLDSISPLVVFVVLVAIIIFIHLPFTPHSAQFLAIIKSGLSGCVSGLCLCLWLCGLWLGVGLSTIQARSATSPLKISVMMRKMMEITRSRWFPAQNHLHTYIHICMNEKKGGGCLGWAEKGNSHHA